MSAYREQAVKLIQYIFCDPGSRAYIPRVDEAITLKEYAGASNALISNHPDDPLAELLADLIL